MILSLTATALLVWLFLRFPVMATLVILLVGILPMVFAMTPGFVEDYSAIGYGLNAEDLVLVAMLAAVIIQHFKHREDFGTLGLSSYIVIFGFWLSFEVIRNVGAYGLSAPGEFRYRYLILVLPVYVYTFFKTPEKRLQLLKILILSALVFPLVCIPVIGQLKGWGVGADSRFLNAQISLGLVYGLIALLLSIRSGILRVHRVLVWCVALAALCLVITDTHRSVWLAGIACLVALLMLKEIRVALLLRIGLPIALIAGGLIFISSDIGNFLLNYVTGRAEAFVDYRGDQNANWRVAIWTGLLSKIIEHPIVGEGFGGYWETYLPETAEVVTVSPHSLYLQSLVKMGAVGLGLYFAVVVILVKALLNKLRQSAYQSREDRTLMLIALVVLVASHLFYIVYSFEYYTWLFVGVGCAVMRTTTQNSTR